MHTFSSSVHRIKFAMYEVKREGNNVEIHVVVESHQNNTYMNSNNIHREGPLYTRRRFTFICKLNIY